MRPLPTGQYPYNGVFDCLVKICRYESQQKYGSNVQSLFAGLEAYWIRLFLICYLSQFLLDYYHAKHYVQEFWQPARFTYHSGIDYDIHEPFTDAFNKQLVASYAGSGGLPAAHPSGKDSMIII